MAVSSRRHASLTAQPHPVAASILGRLVDVEAGEASDGAVSSDTDAESASDASETRLVGRAWPGCVALYGDDHELRTLASTGNVGAFLARRVSEGSGISTFSAVRTGSLFEADAVFLEVAATVCAATWRQAADRWRAWFVRLDPSDQAPSWRKTDLRDLSIDDIDPSVFYGPLADKHAAARAGRAIDDGFDLCREPARLAKAPHATACVYKEMGRCAAPCDGSETLESFRSRVRDAVEAASGGFVDVRLTLDAAVADHAKAMRFEAAAAARDRLTSLEVFAKPAMVTVRTLDRFGVVAILPSGRTGWARVIAHAGGETRWIADVAAGSDDSGVEMYRDAAAWASEAAARGPGSELGTHRLGLVWSHVVASRRSAGRRSRSTIVTLAEAPGDGAIVRALRRAAKAAVVADVDEGGSLAGAARSEA